MRRVCVACFVVSAVLAARVGDAGQVFVNVGGGLNTFNPANVGVLNQGDHIVWRFLSSGHTVTQGTSGSGTGGIFNTDPAGLTTQTAGAFFSWKTDQLGVVPYYCRPHFFSGMKGNISIPVNGTQEADFRITEVRYDGVGSNFIEIANLGDADGDLNGFRLSINGNAAIRPWSTPTPVGPFGRVVLNNPAGLTTSGSVALYVPMTVVGGTPGTTLITDVTMMIDYVEWGATGGQPLEAVAILTSNPPLWSLGQFAPQVAQGHDISFCGIRSQYGAAFWSPTLNPTPGATNDCVNPSVPYTWGRLKTLYR